MKKLWLKLFGALCGVSTETRGAGLGRGTNRGSNLAYWKKLAGIKAAVAVVLTVGGPEAMAADGSWADVTNSANAMTRDMPGNDNPLTDGTGGMPHFGKIPNLGLEAGGASWDAGWSLGELVGGWINSWSEGDGSISEDYEGAPTGLGGGSCCGSDTLGTGGMRTEPGPGGY